MIALLQRVSRAKVTVENQVVGEIEKGLMVLICMEPNDTEATADKLLNRIITYRVFNDENGKMNRSLEAIQGGLLLVPQFTLAADTKSGTRPSFSTAAPVELGKRLFAYVAQKAKDKVALLQTGEFGAHMQVELVNDGPVTFWLQVS